MRPFILAAAAMLLLTGCGQQEGSQGEAVSDSLAAASPGVAWRFTYDYALDDRRIEMVQERHAARCEQLGPDRCRITGLRYTVGQENEVSGMLELRLQPSIARQFGKAALADVRSADGKLVRSEFTGEDVGTEVASARQTGEQLAASRADLQRRIDAAAPGTPERAELQRQLSALVAQADEQRRISAAGTQRLTFTPVTFNYFGEGGIPGFRENPLKAGFKLMVGSFVTMISFVLQAVGLLLPWLLLFGILVLLWRSRPLRAARQWWTRQGAPSSYRDQREEEA
jgi:hypothetical protein